ncbi:MAG: hypothetical protein K0Q65_451 [Clostridia bacterium]|jgi:cell division septum initiation protein DivIVA|nr:hypothetical protein [Clostridia bacterium]
MTKEIEEYYQKRSEEVGVTMLHYSRFDFKTTDEVDEFLNTLKRDLMKYMEYLKQKQEVEDNE